MIIYKITNNKNDKVYIGQTVRKLDRRFNAHCNYNEDKTGHISYVSRAIKKYGKENFTIEQIDSAETLDELNEKEIYWIKFYNSITPNGYNIREGGNGRLHASSVEKIKNANFGKKMPEEAKRKISETLLLNSERNSMLTKNGMRKNNVIDKLNNYWLRKSIGKSKYIGVTICNNGKFRARISDGIGKRFELGKYFSEHEAAISVKIFIKYNKINRIINDIWICPGMIDFHGNRLNNKNSTPFGPCPIQTGSSTFLA